jgi:hypothetical protein
MRQGKGKPETKYWNLTIVIDIMNADFAAGHLGRGVRYLVDSGLNAKTAAAIQRTILATHAAGSVMPLRDEIERCRIWEFEPAPDKRSFTLTQNVSGAEQRLFAALVNVINRGDFWRLRRCRMCAKFFAPGAKQRYCTAACLAAHNSKTAQERVERARRKRRFKEVFPKLLRLQKIAKSTSFREMMDKVPGFDPKLLAIIAESKEPLNKLVSQIKYRNRKLLLQAKL